MAQKCGLDSAALVLACNDMLSSGVLNIHKDRDSSPPPAEIAPEIQLAVLRVKYEFFRSQAALAKPLKLFDRIRVAHLKKELRDAPVRSLRVAEYCHHCKFYQ